MKQSTVTIPGYGQGTQLSTNGKYYVYFADTNKLFAYNPHSKELKLKQTDIVSLDAALSSVKQLIG